MDKETKILTVCQKGIVRSVATRYLLCKNGYNNVIAIGQKNTSYDTFDMLCHWADIILLAHPRFSRSVPIAYKDKIDANFVIGTDIWRNPHHKDLQRMLAKQLAKLGYF